ncbi:MAG: hypothetical protein WBW73_28855 [Rhodoplanes sp.]
MKQVELYAKVRYAVQIEGLSKRAAARRFGIDPRTVDKMVEFSVPPGYRRLKPPARPKLGPFIAVIDKTLADDTGRPKKQQHTAKLAQRSKLVAYMSHFWSRAWHRSGVALNDETEIPRRWRFCAQAAALFHRCCGNSGR